MSDHTLSFRKDALGDNVRAIGLSLKSVLLWGVALVLLFLQKVTRKSHASRNMHKPITTEFWACVSKRLDPNRSGFGGPREPHDKPLRWKLALSRGSEQPLVIWYAVKSQHTSLSLHYSRQSRSGCKADPDKSKATSADLSLIGVSSVQHLTVSVFAGGTIPKKPIHPRGHAADNEEAAL